MEDHNDDMNVRDVDHESIFARRDVSRRQFLKVAGLAGATVGAAAGLGGLLAACGEEAETTTTAGATTTTTAGATTTTTAAATTTVSTAAETGREVKLGFVTPTTGALGFLRRPRRILRRTGERGDR